MKIITIGRDPDNMITLDDPKISRHQALLRCYPFGKMELIDLSQNGTFVNGMRIASNKPYPLTRNDIVTFSHAEKLDWNSVPAPHRRIKRLILISTAIIAAIFLGSYLYANYDTSYTSIEDAPLYAEPVLPSKPMTKVPEIISEIEETPRCKYKELLPKPENNKVKVKKKKAEGKKGVNTPTQKTETSSPTKEASSQVEESSSPTEETLSPTEDMPSSTEEVQDQIIII